MYLLRPGSPRLRRKLLALATGGTVALLSITACSSDDPDESGGGSGEKVVHFLEDVSPSGFDPATATNSPDHGIVREIYNGLIRFKPGDNEIFEPDLAETWESSDDGLVWTFNLRKGVQCQKDFGELTAKDVVFSYERASDPDQSVWSAEWTGVDTITAVDDYTVEIKLKHPDAYFEGLVANVKGGLVVCQAAVEEYGEDFAVNPVGTGPFQFDSFIPDQELILTANDDYFRGAPALDAINFRFVGDENARRLAVENGEAEVARGTASQDWIDSVSDDLEVVSGGLGGSRALQFNMRVKPLDNVLVRRALYTAYNPEDLKAFLGGNLVRYVPSVLAPDWPEYLAAEDQIPTYDFDIEKAKDLLAEAGYPDGFTISFLMSGEENSLRPMEIIQDQWAKIGVTLDMQIVEKTAYREATDSGENAMGIIGPRYQTPDAQMRTYYHSESEGVYNWSGYGIVTPGIDDLLDKARETLDEAARTELYVQAQVQVMEDVPLIPIYNIMSPPQVYDPDRFDFGYEMKTTEPGSFMNILTEQSKVL